MLLRSYINLLIAKPSLGFLIAGLFFASGVFLGKDIIIDNDFRKMVIQDGGGIELLDKHNETFGPDDTTLTYALTASTSPDDAFFDWMTDLANELLMMDEVLRIDAPVTTAVPHNLDGGLYIGPVLGKQAPSSVDTTTGIAALSEALSGRHLMSADQTTFIFSVVLNEEFKSVVEVARPAESIDQRMAESLAAANLQVDIQRMGIAFTRLAAVEGIKRDLGLLLPIAYLLVGILLWRLYPRLYAVVLPPTSLGIACIMTIGFSAAIGEPITPLSVAFPILVLVIGLGDALHLLNRFHELRRAGVSAAEAARDACTTVGRACFLTTLTSSIGFASLMLTDMPILVGFGLVSSVGIWMAFIVSMTLLPAALSRVQAEAPPLRAKTSDRSTKLMRLAGTRGRALMLLSFGALGCVALGVASQSITIDYHFSKILNTEHPVALGNQTWDKEFPGLLAIDLNLVGPPGAFRDPAVLAALEGFRSDAERELAFKTSIGLSVFLRDIQRALTGQSTLPSDDAGIGQTLLFAESRRDAIETLTNFDYSAARISFSKASAGGSETLRLASELERRCRESLGSDSPIKVRATGINVLSSEGFAALVGRLVESLFSALGLIILTMSIVFRSLRVGLASILPNTLPLVAVTGIFSLSETPLELMPAVMFCIAIGIAVDDTIHFLARFLDEHRAGTSVDDAIAASLRGSLGPVVDTSLIIMTGFGVLLFSSFPANQTSAVLGVTIMGLALLSDLFVMPATMRVGWGQSERG